MKMISNFSHTVKPEGAQDSRRLSKGLVSNEKCAYRLAAESYELALETCSPEQEGFILGNLAAVYLQTRQFDKVISVCKRGLEIDPDILRCPISVSEAKKVVKKLDSAIAKVKNVDKAIVMPKKRKGSESKQKARKVSSSSISKKGRKEKDPNAPKVVAWTEQENMRLVKEVKALGGKIPKWYNIIEEKGIFPERSASSVNSQYNQLLRKNSPLIDPETLRLEQQRREILKARQVERINKGERAPLKSDQNQSSSKPRKKIPKLK